MGDFTTMNDHNLDDLIIDNIDPKTSKTKSFLTIIALAIVVLIVAIILTKIVLKDPNEKLVLDESDTEMISPDLILQPSTSKTDTSAKESKSSQDLALHTPAKETVPTQHTVIEPTVSSLSSQKKANSAEQKKAEEKARIEKEKAEQARLALEKEKIAAQKALEEKLRKEAMEKEAALKEERIAAEKERQERLKREAAAKQAVQTSYYIQVGSFTQTPSSRFLSIIKKSGFDYTITPPNASGSKKLLIGPYSTRAQADTALVRVRDRINKSAFVVKK